MQRKPYTRYSREFKLEAVRQAALGEKPKAQIARALGIRVGHLRDWRLQFEEEARTGVTHPPPAVSQDLEQLRRENAKLKVENEILKKAAIYFAGDKRNRGVYAAAQALRRGGLSLKAALLLLARAHESER